MNNNDQGFTLIELMIVVAIIGVLAAIAIPLYGDYIARSQMSEAPALIDGAKTTIETYISEYASFPTNLSALGIRTSGKYVQGITVGNTNSSGQGTLTVTFRATGVSAKLHGKTIQWKRSSSGVWTCSSSTISTTYLPATCK